MKTECQPGPHFSPKMWVNSQASFLDCHFVQTMRLCRSLHYNLQGKSPLSRRHSGLGTEAGMAWPALARSVRRECFWRHQGIGAHQVADFLRGERSVGDQQFVDQSVEEFTAAGEAREPEGAIQSGGGLLR